MKHQRQSEKGQIALAILLIMGVVLTISLAVANRTTSDIAQTIQTSSAAKVFSQAESATENKLNELIVDLQAGTIPEEILNPSAQGDQIVTATSFEHISNYNQDLAVGDIAQIKLEDPDGGGPLIGFGGDSLSVSWGSGEPNSKASLIISEYFEDGDQIRSRYQFIRPSCADESGDGFLTVNCASDVLDQVSYSYNLVSAPLTPLLVRIQPVYHPTNLTVVGEGEELPPQQFRITTQAVNKEEDIQQNSAIEVVASHLLPPPFLDYTVFSGGDIVK